MFHKTFYLLFISVLFSLQTNAQSITGRSVADQTRGATRRQQSGIDEDNETKPLGSPEDEMFARNEIKYYEKLHQENIDRARKALELSAKLRDVYVEHKSFGQPERKNLERLEKLIRRIRSAAGGSSGDKDEVVAPRDLFAALARLTETAEALHTGVEKTPRMVVSAAVIERTNELLQLIRYLRTTTR